PSRRSAQTVLATVLTSLVRLVAPILSFTAEEVWQFAPESLRDGAESVLLAGWPSVQVPADEAAALRGTYGAVLEARDAVTKALEDARNEKVVGKSQEASIVLGVPADGLAALQDRGLDALAEMFIVSTVTLELAEEISVSVKQAGGDKCPRCWNVRELGEEGLCSRCEAVVAGIA
ncbi:MAG: class I tRNA ligase family protein, partial [Coriobacteriia bacterium]|nr:class I tRNA ligase family protein [Coriobacteriia bacterium]